MYNWKYLILDLIHKLSVHTKYYRMYAPYIDKQNVPCNMPFYNILGIKYRVFAPLIWSEARSFITHPVSPPLFHHLSHPLLHLSSFSSDYLDFFFCAYLKSKLWCHDLKYFGTNNVTIDLNVENTRFESREKVLVIIFT